MINRAGIQLSSVLSLIHVWLFATPWTAAHQASLSITNFWSLLKLIGMVLYMINSLRLLTKIHMMTQHNT